MEGMWTLCGKGIRILIKNNCASFFWNIKNIVIIEKNIIRKVILGKKCVYDIKKIYMDTS
jgi:hypothetical protein